MKKRVVITNATVDGFVKVINAPRTGRQINGVLSKSLICEGSEKRVFRF
jgi:hypothetical protein